MESQRDADLSTGQKKEIARRRVSLKLPRRIQQ